MAATSAMQTAIEVSSLHSPGAKSPSPPPRHLGQLVGARGSGELVGHAERVAAGLAEQHAAGAVRLGGGQSHVEPPHWFVSDDHNTTSDCFVSMTNRVACVVYTSEYPIFYVTVDVVCLTVRDGVFSVLLVERGERAVRGRLRAARRFRGIDEDLEDAARRELVEETEVGAPAVLEQLATYGDPTGTRAAAWSASPTWRWRRTWARRAAAPTRRPRTGYPVDEALAAATAGVRPRARSCATRSRGRAAKLEWSPLATSFCPPEFTIADLRGVYEAVWGVRLDPANFHRKVTRRRGLRRARRAHRRARPGPAGAALPTRAARADPPAAEPGAERLSSGGFLSSSASVACPERAGRNRPGEPIGRNPPDREYARVPI